MAKKKISIQYEETETGEIQVTGVHVHDQDGSEHIMESKLVAKGRYTPAVDAFLESHWLQAAYFVEFAHNALASLPDKDVKKL